MSIKSEMSYWVVCDGCGARPDDDGFDILHQSPEKAVEWATGGDWWTVPGGKHVCDSCVDWDQDGDPIMRTSSDRGSSADH